RKVRSKSYVLLLDPVLIRPPASTPELKFTPLFLPPAGSDLPRRSVSPSCSWSSVLKKIQKKISRSTSEDCHPFRKFSVLLLDPCSILTQESNTGRRWGIVFTGVRKCTTVEGRSVIVRVVVL